MPARHAPALTDPALTPDDEHIREVLGDSFTAWQSLETALAGPEFGLDLAWRHYREGGWLRKALHGTRTVAWLAVWEGCATITFYFAARHRRDLVALRLPKALRAQAAEAEMSGALLPLVVEIRSQDDVDAALEVLRYKLRAR